MSVEAATQRDLAKLPDDLAQGSLAASALALAREMDSDSSATSKSMCAKAHLELMDRLRELAPPEVKRTGLDDLTDELESRRRRNQGGAATAN